MAYDTLVEPPLALGERLVNALAGTPLFPMQAAGWVLDDDGWRLYFVLDAAEPDGVRPYLEIARAISEGRSASEREVSFNVVGPNHPIGRSLMKWAPTETALAHRYGATGPDIYIRDAYVYRLPSASR